jgi:hypothetical protein
VTFLNPWVLAGLAAVGVPLAIHLLNKFRVRETGWAAMRFVLASVRQNQRRIRLQDLILLLLRCAFVILIVLAFAHPVFRTATAKGTTGSADTIALVLDNSASMGQTDGVTTRFDRAKEEIVKLVGNLPPDAEVALFTASNRADALVVPPTTDRARVLKSLELTKLSDRSTDLSFGLRAACEALAARGSARREVIVFTDSQSAAWRNTTALRGILDAYPQTTITPNVVGGAGENNLAVTSLKVDGGLVAGGQPCRVYAEIANFGTSAVPKVRVLLSLNDDPPSSEAILESLDPGETRAVGFTTKLTESGDQTVTVRIPPDHLAIDNERSVAVCVSEAHGVLVAEGERGEGADRDAFYLVNALAPVAAGSDETAMRIGVTPFDRLGGIDLSKYSVVFLCNPSDPDEGLTEALRAYVGAGGNLVIFPGSRTRQAGWGADTRAGELLPAALGESRENQPPLGLQSSGFHHEVTARWNERGVPGWGGVTFYRQFPLAVRESPANPVGILLRLTSGEPAAVEWKFGKGRVVLFNSSARAEESTLPLHPGYVALMQRLMGFLLQGRQTAFNLAPGEVFELAVPRRELGKPFSVLFPGEKASRPFGQVEAAGEDAVIRFTETAATGIYGVFLGDSQKPTAVFTVQLDPAESDLRQAPATEIAQRIQTNDSGDHMPVSVVLKSREQDLTIPLLWAAALIALVEAFLAHRLSRPA